MINYFKGGDTMLLKLITKKFPCCKPNARLKSRSLYRMAENPEEVYLRIYIKSHV